MKSVGRGFPLQVLLAAPWIAALAESREQCLNNQVSNDTATSQLIQKSRLGRKDVATFLEDRDECLTKYMAKVNSAHSGFTIDSIAQIMRSKDIEARQSDRTLILCAGQGTTASVGVASALEALGLHGYHWSHDVATANENVLDGELPSYTKDIWEIIRGTDKEKCHQALAEYDFTNLPNNVDYVSDTPFPETFLMFYQQFPRAKVILSSRPSAEWVERRVERHSGTPPPLLNPCGSGLIGNYTNQQLEVFFDAYNELVRCVVPAENFLEIDVFSDTSINMTQAFDGFIFGSSQS